MIPRIEPISVSDVTVPPVPRSGSVPPPVTSGIRIPIIDVPHFDVPSYEPIDYTPENIKPVPPKEGANTPQEPSKPPKLPETPPLPDIPKGPLPDISVPVVEVPIVGEVPIPPKEQVILAGTTAVAVTTATLGGKYFVEQMLKVLKPLVKQLILRGKKLLGREYSDYELQMAFAFDLQEKGMKKVAKALEKDRKAEMARQLQAHELQCQNRSLHTANLDET